MKNNTLLRGLPTAMLIFLIFSGHYSIAQWTVKSPAPQYRSDLSESVIYGGKLYTFLGFYDHDRYADSTADAYDPATDSYALLAPLPGEPMTHEKIVLVDNTAWLIGGRLGQNPGPLTNKIWIYNFSSNSWSRGPDLVDPESGDSLPWAAGGAALIGRTLHIFGGFIYTACKNDQSKYHLTLDVDSWLSDPSKQAEWKNDLTPMPIKRNHFSTVVYGGKIYALGGQFDHDCGGVEKRYSHVYDPSDDSWTALPLLPKSRSHAEGSSFAIDGKIFLLGGQDENGASTARVTIFDPAAANGMGRWEDDSLLTLPNRYEGGTGKIIGDILMYSHGGEHGSAHPGKETFTRIVKRKPVYKFGFPAGCLALNADSGVIAAGSTLVFTFDSSKSYTITSNTPWLSVTKNASGITTPNAVDVGLAANAAGLVPGHYKGTITISGAGTGPEFKAATFCVSFTVTSPYRGLQKFEAESARLKGAKTADNHTGYSGKGFADYIHAEGDYIEWPVNKLAAGRARLIFRYANGKPFTRPMQLSVNGVVVTSALSFPSTGSWKSWSAIYYKTNLKTGLNTIRLSAGGYNGPNIDYLAYANDTASLPAQERFAQNKVYAAGSISTGYVFPNPASQTAALVINEGQGKYLDAEIVDLLGRSYKKIKLLNAGSIKFSFSVKEMPAGMYVLRLKEGNLLKAIPFIVDHKN